MNNNEKKDKKMEESRQVRRARERAEAKANKTIKLASLRDDECTILAIVKYKGQLLFAGCGKTIIPEFLEKDQFGSKKWEKYKDSAFGRLADLKLYNNGDEQAVKVLTFVASFLQYSITLWSERHYPETVVESIDARSGHKHTIDFNDLGCVFEYELKDHPKSVTGVSIHTNGPRWMLGADVVKEAKSYNLMREVA